MLSKDTDLLFTGIPRTALFRQYPTSIIKIPELYVLQIGDTLFLENPSSFQLLFVLQGELSLWDTNKEVERLDKGMMYMLPIGTLLNLRVEEAQTKLLHLIFTPSLHLCAMQCPSSQEMKEVEDKIDSIACQLNSRRITKLYFSEGITSWIESVSHYLYYDTQDLRLFDVKLQEFFILLRLSYSRMERDLFMRYFHCKDTGFKARVYRGQLSWRTVEEMGESLGVSHSHLKRLFADEFGLAPAKWLAEQKARYIYRDLIEGKLELSEIAEKYHFSSLSYMSVFSKKMFGDTPLKIRNESLFRLSWPRRKRQTSSKESNE